MTAEELFQYGIDTPNTPYAGELAEALIKNLNIDFTKDGLLIFEAGKYWTNAIYSKDLLKELMIRREYELLFRVFKEWHSDRYCAKELSQFLLKYAPIELIINKIENFTDECYDKIFLNILLDKLGDGDESFHTIAEHWPKDKYDKYIFKALVPYWYEDLLIEQSEWPDVEGCSEIVVDELLTSRFIESIVDAVRLFDKKNYDERLFEAVVERGSLQDFYEVCNSENVPYSDRILSIINDKIEKDIDEFLYFAEEYGCEYFNIKWPGITFSSYIVEKLFEMDCIDQLFEAGLYWNDDTFVPKIGHCLFKLGNDEYIEKARKEWPKDRIKYVGKPKIFIEY